MRKILIGIILSLSFCLIGCNSTTNASYEYEHSNVWYELEGVIDEEVVDYFTKEAIDIYIQFAGKDGDWKDTDLTTVEEKINFLYLQGKTRKALYTVNIQNLNENEEVYIEELLDCTFSRLVNSEDGKDSYCKEHKPN